MAPHYPKLLGLESEPVELVGCTVGRDVLAEAVEYLHTGDPPEDEPSEASCLVTISFPGSIHWPWQ